MEAAARHAAVFQAFGQGAQVGLDAIPVVQRRLQRRGDQKGVREPVQVIGDDDETAVAAVLERGEFHASGLGGFSVRGNRLCDQPWLRRGLPGELPDNSASAARIWPVR